MSAEPRIIDAKRHELGGLPVARVLPRRACRAVGPFVFLDHIGPTELAPGRGMDVPPHPHIGLATATYLYDGEIVHRDSLGFEQTIRPGDLNWMIAGSGIVHSERSGPEFRTRGGRVHGLQFWVALPKAHEETQPAFHHHPASSLPEFERPGARLRLLAGAAYGQASPVRVLSPMFYLDVKLEAGSTLVLPSEHEERAAYVLEGRVQAEGLSVGPSQLLVMGKETVSLRSTSAARLILFGGAALTEPRHMVWNFVSTSAERIERARQDWIEGRFPAVPGDEDRPVPFPG